MCKNIVFESANVSIGATEHLEHLADDFFLRRGSGDDLAVAGEKELPFRHEDVVVNACFLRHTAAYERLIEVFAVVIAIFVFGLADCVGSVLTQNEFLRFLRTVAHVKSFAVSEQNGSPAKSKHTM